MREELLAYRSKGITSTHNTKHTCIIEDIIANITAQVISGRYTAYCFEKVSSSVYRIEKRYGT